MLLGVGGQLTACKLEQVSSPYWDLSVLKYDGTRVGTDDGSWPFCLSGLFMCLVPGSCPVGTCSVPGGGGLVLCSRYEKSWNGSSAWAGFPPKDLAGYPGGTPPHPDLTQQAHLPHDPHCSLFSSLGRCNHSRSPLPPQPHPVLFSWVSWGPGQGL